MFDNVKAVFIMFVIEQLSWIDSVIQYLLFGVMARAIRHHQALTIENVEWRLEKKTERGDFMNVILMQKGTDKEMTWNDIYAVSKDIVSKRSSDEDMLK